MHTRDLLAIIGGLSTPDKMPCRSYSIPAKHCRVGSTLKRRKGTTCSICYAEKGMYLLGNVQTAMERRYTIVQRAIADPKFRRTYVYAFSTLLNRMHDTHLWRVERGLPIGRNSDHRFFRWFDSGDLQGDTHLGMICDIARRTPRVRHWLPTREYNTIRGRAMPHNLVLRVSSPFIDSFPYFIAGRMTVSSVHSTQNSVPPHYDECPAYTQDGHCGDCRACWAKLRVTYPSH